MGTTFALHRLARFSLVLLGATLLASVAVIALHNALGSFSPGEVRLALALSGVLFVPGCVSLNSIVNTIDAQTKGLLVQPDEGLLDLVRPLIHGMNWDVTVGQYPSNEANAFALSSVVGSRAVIAFSSELLRRSSREELFAIAAHEVSHIKHGDSKSKALIIAFYEAVMVYPELLSELSKRSLKSLAPILSALLAFAFIALAMMAGPERAVAALRPALFVLLWGAVATTLCITASIALRHALKRKFFAYSREREYAADAAAADMTSTQAMISALRLLDAPTATVSVFDSHPPLEERVKRLSLLKRQSRA